MIEVVELSCCCVLCAELVVDSGAAVIGIVGIERMMPRAASTVTDAKNPASSASSQRPRIGFSIDFLVGNGKNNNNPAAAMADARSQDSGGDESGGKKIPDGKDSPPMRVKSCAPSSLPLPPTREVGVGVQTDISSSLNCICVQKG